MRGRVYTTKVNIGRIRVGCIYTVVDRGVDPRVFSRKGKLGRSDMFIGGVGALPRIFLKLQESW